jgi:uncharacterized protein YjbJ (UPF0337 family)
VLQNAIGAGAPRSPSAKELIMGSTGDKIKGKANEAWGKATGDTSKKIKGKGQQVKGKVREGVEEDQKRAEEDAER